MSVGHLLAVASSHRQDRLEEEVAKLILAIRARDIEAAVRLAERLAAEIEYDWAIKRLKRREAEEKTEKRDAG